ncbi:MAG TPA: hypothetical protein VGV38_19570 [Pyrinomonadaceae bacterium]|nr:hypothetical protein [Pyrinomonadaceae bacterium]
MPTHSELAAQELPEFEEKLRNLKSHVRELKEAAERHDDASEHFEDDLLKAENDAAYYEAEVERLRQAAGVAPPPPTGPLPVRTDTGSLVQTGLAFAAGIFVGLLIVRGRDAD